MHFTSNEKGSAYRAEVSPTVRYEIYSGGWVSAARKVMKDDGRWYVTHRSPQKTWLAIGPARTWATELANELGE